MLKQTQVNYLTVSVLSKDAFYQVWVKIGLSVLEKKRLTDGKVHLNFRSGELYKTASECSGTYLRNQSHFPVTNASNNMSCFEHISIEFQFLNFYRYYVRINQSYIRRMILIVQRSIYIIDKSC